MDDSNYLDINRASWNKRVVDHVDSEFYDNASFLNGKSSLNTIELELLGDIAGKSVLHLQCHFGQDTISMARMGAKTVGVDLSDVATAKGTEMAKQLGAATSFVTCDVYDVPNQIEEQFDIVFTSYGTIGWLPDIDKWAAVIAKMLKPGGRFIFAEFHPVVWMFDDDFNEVKHRYFKNESIKEIVEGSYAATDSKVELETITWNHGLGEVVGSLRKQNLNISQFKEYDYSPYGCFAGAEKIADRKYRIKKFGNQIPMVYAIEAIKPN